MKKKSTKSLVKAKPVGRPSSYKPEYCESLIDKMASGFSFEAFAGSVNVSKETAYNWCDKHPEFLYAKKIGFALCQLWWETEGHKGLRDKTFNSAIWIFNMKNRFNWRDKHEVDAKVDTVVQTKHQQAIDELKTLIKAEFDERAKGQ